jgi:hypothetical protein
MTDYGGYGGVAGGRPLSHYDAFEHAVNAALGDAMRADKELCCDVWGALSNTSWTHVNGDTASYSFRAAGDLVAAVSGKGDYMTWYCCGPYGTISERIAAAMEKHGWTGAPTRYPETQV